MGPISMPGASAQVPLDDLLQAQYNNTQVMEFFDEGGKGGGGLRVNGESVLASDYEEVL